MVDFVKRQDRLMRAVERPFKRKIVSEKNRYIKQQAERYRKTGKLNEDDLAEHKQNMAELFRFYYKRIIKTMVQEVTDQTLPKHHSWRIEKKAEAWEFFYRQWVQEHGAKEAETVSQTTQEDIRRTILQFDEGVSESQAVRQILTVRGLSAFRADTIARTETHNAAMFASRRTAEKISVDTGRKLLKKWNPVIDDRTRPDHIDMEDTAPIPQDAMFNVGGVRMDRPGDPTAPAEQIINCRCVLTHRPVRD
jgi:uncharacterized protein with gpF-like domain